MLTQGHPHAGHYPVCQVWTEATIAQQRINQHFVTEAVLIQAAIISAVGGGKEFGKMIKGLSDGDE